MKYAVVILLFIGLALAAPKQNPLLQADDCLHCVEDIVNAVAQCEVRIYCFSHRNSCRISEKIIHTVFPTGIFKEFFKNSDGICKIPTEKVEKHKKITFSAICTKLK